MNVPKSVVFDFTDVGVKAVMTYSLPEGRNGTKSATFGLAFSDYPSVGACAAELLREMGIHAQQVDERYEADAKRQFLEGLC